MSIRLSSKEINRRKVTTLMNNVQANKITKLEAVKDLNQRFDRMKSEDVPWYDDLYPKYIALMRLA